MTRMKNEFYDNAFARYFLRGRWGSRSQILSTKWTTLLSYKLNWKITTFREMSNRIEEIFAVSISKKEEESYNDKFLRERMKTEDYLFFLLTIYSIKILSIY